MTETDIRLTIASEILDEDGGREINEYTLPGVLRTRDGCHLLSYAETGEGGEVRSELFVAEGRVRLCRTGAIRSKILFSEGNVHRSLYEIPPYRFDMTVTTEKVHCSFSADGGKIDLVYRTVIGGAARRCRLTLRILPDTSRKGDSRGTEGIP